MLQNVIKTWKTRKNRKDTCWGVFFALAISESMFFRAHFASNLDAFCINFACFLTLSPSKATPGTAKMNAFWCILARHALGCIFCACETGMHDFSCSFCVGFGRGLGQFCMIFDTIPWQSKSGNSSKSANFVIYHDFWCIFSSRKKFSPQWNSLFFWKKPWFRSIFGKLHMPVIKTSEIIIYPRQLKNHQKMNVSPSVDAIWGGTGAGCTEHRKMDCRLNIFLYIVQ